MISDLYHLSAADMPHKLFKKCKLKSLSHHSKHGLIFLHLRIRICPVWFGCMKKPWEELKFSRKSPSSSDTNSFISISNKRTSGKTQLWLLIMWFFQLSEHNIYVQNCRICLGLSEQATNL